LQILQTAASRQHRQGDLNGFFGGSFANGFNAPSRLCDNGFLRSQNIATLRSYGLCQTAFGALKSAGTLPLTRHNVDWRPTSSQTVVNL